MLAGALTLGLGVVQPAGAAAELTWRGPIAHDYAVAGTSHYSAVACPLISQCTAIDELGDEVTFDPRGGAITTAATVDPGARVVYSLTCPSAMQCTAVDLDGRAVTFNPQSPAKRASRLLAPRRALLAVACPSRFQCTVVDSRGDESTYNPWGARRGPHVWLRAEAGSGITGLACPTVTRCVVVDGAGEFVGFDPRAPGRPEPSRLLNDAAIAVVCPAAALCVVAGSRGERVTLAIDRADTKPSLSLRVLSRARVDPVQPDALACPSVTYCVLVDSAGHAVEFDPGGSGATASSLIVADASFSGVACAAPTLCVAVDSVADAFAGAGQLPVLPVAAARPVVSGKPIQGDRLSGSADWTGVETSLHVRWERCSRGGSSCHRIPGATGLRYKLTAADLGHRLRLVAQAANQAGFGASVVSVATRVVRAGSVHAG